MTTLIIIGSILFTCAAAVAAIAWADRKVRSFGDEQVWWD